MLFCCYKSLTSSTKMFTIKQTTILDTECLKKRLLKINLQWTRPHTFKFDICRFNTKYLRSGLLISGDDRKHMFVTMKQRVPYLFGLAPLGAYQNLKF